MGADRTLPVNPQNSINPRLLGLPSLYKQLKASAVENEKSDDRVMRESCDENVFHSCLTVGNSCIVKD